MSVMAELGRVSLGDEGEMTGMEGGVEKSQIRR